MFTRIGELTVSRPKTILLVSLLALTLAAGVGGGVFDRLKSGGFEDPAAESTLATDLLDEQFDTGAPNVVLLVTAPSNGNVDDPAVAAEGMQITEILAGLEAVDADDVASYWSLGSPEQLASVDNTRALVLGRISGDSDQIDGGIEEVVAAFADDRTGVTVEVGGAAEVFRQIGSTIEGDLARAESIAVPATLILLVIVFGGLLAALLPLAVGVLAVFGAFGVLFLLTGMTDVSVFSINLVTALGLGLAIDYSLFIVSRFREELATGRDVDSAVIRTVETAGRTVTFSALTVAISLAALLIFPLYFLRSFAYAGIGVILVAMVASAVTLPALLKLLGLRLTPKKAPSTANAENFWGRMATRVMKRPIAVALSITVVLILLGMPFFNVVFGVPDDRVLPEGNSARQVSEVIRTEFDSAEADAFPIVIVDGEVPSTNIDAYASAVSSIETVSRVDSPSGRWIEGQRIAPADPSLARLSNGSEVWLNVIPGVEPISPEAETMIGDIRDIDTSFETAVGGDSATLVDSKAAIFSLVPVAALFIGVATFVLLFLMFGSVLVPLKAIVLNILSLSATFGLMVWVFQDGHGSGLLGFTPTGLTDTTTPILMFCIAFGLSMDYEVFLLSRIKEEHDRTGDNEQAVVRGMARTGRIVTAAALLLSITFFAFATSGVTFIKLFGLGLGVAVLVDAFIIRATLVPALMAIAGEANWWAPRWMRAVHDRFGLSETEPIDPQDPSEGVLISSSSTR